MTVAVVKSAKRVLQVFELYAQRRRAMTVNEISSELEFPQSSTSVLLHSLVKLGYLTHDPHKRTFSATLRVGLLGNWLFDQELMPMSPMEVAHDLTSATGDAVVVGVQHGINAMYIHVSQATNPVRLYMKPGAIRPLCQTAVGRALLSEKSDAEIKAIVRRINSERAPGSPPQQVDVILKAVRKVRDTGYSATFGDATADAGVVAALLPRIEGQPAMAVGIGAPLGKIKSCYRDYSELLLKRIGRYGAPIG
ncbi:IclR family transcriptional regulator [Pseudorhodoplanes sp.]|uniref:IclR family transcriptional regulator n=1 Tax=Pseudorhodoplanes sp. TaxID=1934341 RepID=UPI002C1CA935|nr:helix-turn-helix domain-containing protein [Pseudorhodoplanes sp.]HWV51033.1 helix-turn-helix domain-containing protein [Pseudorhodoplanes sp.]